MKVLLVEKFFQRQRQKLGVITATIGVAAFCPVALGASLVAPLGIQWGKSPADVERQLTKQNFKLTSPSASPAESLDHFLAEQRYEADVLGKRSDHVAPLFFNGQFFSLVASFSPAPDRPASMIWTDLVRTLTAQYGKPATLSRAERMMSLIAVLKLLPESPEKNELMTLYAAADADRVAGPYLIQDLEIRVGLWVPEAIWKFDHGMTIKAVMRAVGGLATGLSALKPAVIFTNPEIMK